MPQRIDPASSASSAPLERKEPLNKIEKSILENNVVEALRTVYDPEIPVNVYDLGLIYDVQAGDDAKVNIVMTLTSPACPVAGILPGQVEDAARSVPGVKGASVELVWDPPFTLDRVSEEVKLMLGLI